MIDFERIDGPFGVPVYYQRLPVNTVSVSWVMFVGSADDAVGGGEGIYHWFEHLPSRGTEKFPGGYRDTEARLVRHGGGGDAERKAPVTPPRLFLYLLFERLQAVVLLSPVVRLHRLLG